MHALESSSDPKCHATATRLEYSIYGTQLSPKAQSLKSRMQKRFIDSFWRLASSSANKNSEKLISKSLIGTTLRTYFDFEYLDSGGALVQLTSGEGLSIRPRDLRHYSSIAYSLRAMLALRQEGLIQTKHVRLPLEKSAEAALIKATDVATLALLQVADRLSRESNVYEIDTSTLESAWRLVFTPPNVVKALPPATPPAQSTGLLPQLIEKKLLAYEHYNEIRSKVFLRNLQVYFARFKWPKDKEGGIEFKKNFTEANAYFLVDLMQRASEHASREKSPFIREKHVYPALQSLSPHEVNPYEDVIYFPKFSDAETITIESYDIDSFRDSGLHWRYLDYALEKIDSSKVLEPDPFAAELLVEGVAQFAVLLLRLTGEIASDSNAEVLQPEHLSKAFQQYNKLLQKHDQLPVVAKSSPKWPASSSSKAEDKHTRFSEVTEQAKLNPDYALDLS